MKRSRIIGILLLVLLGSVALILVPAQPENPVAILPLGRPYRDARIEDFQITNRSAAEFVVTCRKTMVRANGVWNPEDSG